MTLTIDGQRVPIPPRVAAMMIALLDQKRAIEAQPCGLILIDYGVKNVALKVLPSVTPVRKDIDTVRAMVT